MDGKLNGKTVLVVDDTAMPRMLAADILDSSGVRILEAESGEQAVRIARDHLVDAFLLDIMLPDMNGIELCRALRLMERYKGAPIIFVTALDQREILQWALEAGCDDFIQKPVHAMVLRNRLGNLLQKAAYLKQVELMSLSLRRYLSPRTEEIAKAFATTGLLPAPRQQEVCVLFSDARGFTEMSQAMEPESLFDMLSEHLAAQVDLVYNYGGYIDKFSGDGIMAVFDGDKMVQRCCRCAIDILDMSKASAAHRGSKVIPLGMGMHKGLVMVGNLGSREHLDYTLIGKTVILAARLCGIANRSIVASQAVCDAAADFSEVEFQLKRSVEIRGLGEPIYVYDLARRAMPA
ncbi:MAG: response regulator [Legionella sp.]|nr:response regulator [Legionella sp.]